MSETITVNGEERGMAAATVLELLLQEELDVEKRGLAVARNGSVVPRGIWSETRLRPGDQIEIVKPFSGG